MAGRSSGWGHSNPGRRPGFALSAIELLDKAEVYERSTLHPSQAEFLRSSRISSSQTDIGQTLSQRQLKNWLKGYGFPYPIVPSMDDERREVLVLLVEADKHATLRWASRNVHDFLDADREDLVGRPSSEVLYGGCDPRRDYPELCAEFARLRDGELALSTPTAVKFYTLREHHPVDIQLVASFGDHSNAWYLKATVLQQSQIDQPEAATAIPRSVLDAFTIDDYLRHLPDYVYHGNEPPPESEPDEPFNVYPAIYKQGKTQAAINTVMRYLQDKRGE
jgi:hypothetical protein